MTSHPPAAPRAGRSRTPTRAALPAAALPAAALLAAGALLGTAAPPAVAAGTAARAAAVRAPAVPAPAFLAQAVVAPAVLAPAAFAPAAGAASWALPVGDAAARPVVRTAPGPLVGRDRGGAQEFLGVPYAAPPVGEDRFRAPRPPASWGPPRDAGTQAPACPQFSPFGLRDPSAVSEDCLYLDVYRPRGAHPGSRLPVLFWIHGGAYSQGTGTQFGGRTMAELTGTVVVSINYRLGQLGYLALPELTGGDPLRSGSYGLMDQIAALEWTRRNIAGFGGDPAAVTVAGQSAGAGSVCAMLASPRARGLFARAVLQSGPCTLLRAPARVQAEEQARAYAARLGCADPAAVAACLRGASVARLVDAAVTLPVSGPAYGDGLLPAEPAAALAAGAWNKVPVLIGSTRDEARFFVALTQPRLTAEEYAGQIRARYGPAAEQVLARYPVAGYPSPYLALSAVLTDSTFACHTYTTARLLARQVPTYAYEFDDPDSPTLYGAQVPGLDQSNGHSAELAYLHDFTMAGRPLTEAQTAFAGRMKRHWAAFARTGDPNVPGRPPWPAAGAGSPLPASYTSLTLHPTTTAPSTDFATTHRCGFWEGLAPATL
ncbi:carboxylesterase/lipase family protein [Streptomyces sp. NPDC101118]|uniref:carboxylesterase/lipase family protein n=1 Tax=Streptomyces sp. NPDC101118 TaxID=3366109 RepID=UPI00381D15FB